MGDQDGGGSQEAIARAAFLVRRARYAIALTGAGMSTPSGIRDFRSPGTGLWERVDPMAVASIRAFRRHPERFYAWIHPLAGELAAAVPNAGHLALAQMEAHGWLRAVITQNIDGLHQQAGSREVVELHGSLRQATCMRCRATRPSDRLVQAFLDSGAVPRCTACGGVMRPDVVLFGEELPADAVDAGLRHVERADLMLVAGSSLEVMLAARLPLRVARRGGGIVIVNLTATPLDARADVVVRGDVADVLPRIVRACELVE